MTHGKLCDGYKMGALLAFSRLYDAFVLTIHIGMKIHQMSAQYDSTEDRMLLRINTSEALEYRLWLTRRLVLGWLPQLPKVLSEQLALVAPMETPLLSDRDKDVFAALKKETYMSRSDFSTPYKTPEGEHDSPLVVTEIRCTTQKNGNTRFVFQDKRPSHGTEHNIEMMLTPQMTQALIHLLTEALNQTNWQNGPALPVPAANTALPESNSTLLN